MRKRREGKQVGLVRKEERKSRERAQQSNALSLPGADFLFLCMVFKSHQITCQTRGDQRAIQPIISEQKHLNTDRALIIGLMNLKATGG